MGRPGKDVNETQKEDPLKYRKNFAGKGEKQKTFRSFKKSGGLQKSIGNASTGHGLSHKARILSRFKRSFGSKKQPNNKDTFHIKPLASDRDYETSRLSVKEEDDEDEEKREVPKKMKEGGRLNTLKKDEEFLLKPSPKKHNNKNTDSPRSRVPKFTSSKLAANKNRSSNIGGSDVSLFKKKGLSSDKNNSSSRVELNYEAIEEERQREVMKLQSKRLAKEYEEKISKNIEQRKTVTKSLKQRTKRGQPVMANQIEHILQKVKMTSS